jgi:hypothetical protein
VVQATLQLGTPMLSCRSGIQITMDENQLPTVRRIGMRRTATLAWLLALDLRMMLSSCIGRLLHVDYLIRAVWISPAGVRTPGSSVRRFLLCGGTISSRFPQARDMFLPPPTTSLSSVLEVLSDSFSRPPLPTSHIPQSASSNRTLHLLPIH